jgi:D-arabinose 1-dehydrogenase-like Zn-dependent alcohol dehydrogenase
MSIPSTMPAWRLFGAGMDKFGEQNQPSTVPVPAPNDDQLLMHVEAIGLCFSDVKLIKAGEQHPRVVVPDLAKEPLIPGHEAVLRVVKVGKNLQKTFAVGQRFIIQAEIYFHGKNLAYGYAIDGGMAQYSVMTDPILRGDDGCYLLPISENLSAAEAALIEPWTCVIAAYRIPLRRTLLAGGVLKVVGDGTPAQLDFGAALAAGNAPARILGVNLHASVADALQTLARQHGAAFEACAASDAMADDLIVTGQHSDAALEQIITRLNKGGVCCLVGEQYGGKRLTLDIGRIHYQAWRYVGTPAGDVGAAYARNVRSTLRPGGTVWFPGGAGAMGQMHVQLALEQEQPPRKVVVTDVDDSRLAKLVGRLQRKAAARKIEFVTLNPKTCASPAAFDEQLHAHAPGGFDDIVMLVPVPAVIGDGARFLATDGLMNIFAGVPAGSGATLDLGGIVERGQRYTGSSGSSIDDLKYTLAMTEARSLEPAYALAAVGGMHALKEGIEGVMTARYAGKTVIYPHAMAMPLTPVEQLESICPGAGAQLEQGEILTKKAEDLLRARWEV